MRVFVSDVAGHVGKALRAALAGQDHEIVGTIKPGDAAVAGVKQLAQVGSEEAKQLVLSSQVVFVAFHESVVDANMVVEALRQDVGEAEISVVGISTVMTWAATPKPADAEAGLLEASYKSRKPSPAFNDAKMLESHILNLARNNVRSVVVASGILYGGGEHILHTVFKEAWLCESSSIQVPSVTGGNNLVPMIHVNDLAKICVAVSAAQPASRYIVAVDKAQSSLLAVTEAISKALGPGAVRHPDSKEAESMLVNNPYLDVLAANLAFNTEGVVASLDIPWTAQSGLIENVKAVVKEFIAARNLKPVRVIVMGPPGSGKSTLAARLAAKYYVPHVTSRIAIDQARAPGSELADAVAAAIQSAKDKRLNVEMFSKVIRAALMKPQLRNRGFILDGVPRNMNEAKAVFQKIASEDDEDKSEGSDFPIEPTIAPTAVILLTAEDDCIVSRIRAMPEKEVAGTHNTESDFKRRNNTFKQNNNPVDPNATICFFEKLCHLDTLTCPAGHGVAPDAVVRAAVPYIETGGPTYNYHPTPEEIAAEQTAAAAKAAVAQQAEESAAVQRLAAEQAERDRREEQERQRIAEIEKQEAALLEARSAPLRKYLMDNVLPAITEGLLQVAKVHPDDPVDYLAEFLFRKSTDALATSAAQPPAARS